MVDVKRFCRQIKTDEVFGTHNLAPTFSEAQVLKPPRFNAYYPLESVRPVDAAAWKLELAGRIADKRPWRAHQFDELPIRS